MLSGKAPRVPDSRPAETPVPAEGSTGKSKSAARIGGHAVMEPTSPLVPLSEQLAALELSPEQLRARKLEVLEEILADAGSFADLPEAERNRLAVYAGQLAVADTPFTRCWTPGTPREIVQAYLNVEQRITAAGGFGAMALRVADRWTRTATNSTGQGTQGLPVTITWSIVPDGTPITPTDATESSDPSSLRARMAAIYGGSATGDPTAQPWFPVFQATFDNLAAISGLRFVYEPNDDGVTIDNTTGTTDWGQLGVRGDIRLSGHSIDGNSGVLAYAYYPDNGDVVIDTNDTFYNTITSDSLRLRNILEHEIGHSLGLAHVCPVNQTKLMEPFINLGFRGSQFDDIYSHQRNYGDPLEVHGALRNNDSVASATAISLVAGTTAAWQWLSIDDSTDLDHYSFTGSTTQQVTVRIIPSDPIAPTDPNVDTYLEGAQNTDGSCSAGTDFDPTTQQDLILDLIGTNGTTVVASAPVQAAGVTEQIVNFQLPANGTHTIRVRGGAADRAQLYRMEVLLVNAAPAPLVVIDAVRLDAESNSGGNGLPDPGETVRYGITLSNQGNVTASNVTATLSGPGGTTLFTALGSYGNLAPGASAERLFTFAMSGVAGEVKNLQLAVTGTSYSVSLPFSLTLGGIGPATPISANFDGSSALPAGWSQSVLDGATPWAVTPAFADSPPNSARATGVAVAGEALLVSPTVTVGSTGGTLEFRHRYDLQADFDGAVLEASREGGLWFDLMREGGTVEAGDYNTTIRPNAKSPLARKPAWSGASGGFVTTRVSVPSAWAGGTIAFRWRLVHNDSTASAGWNVDNVTFTTVAAVADPFRPFVSLATSATSLSESTPAQQAQLTLSTPLPLVQTLNVTPVLSGTADAADIGGPLSFTLPAGALSTIVARSATPDGVSEGTETLVISIPATDPGFAAAAPSSVSIQVSDGSVIPATVTLSGLNPTYTGTPKSPTVTTNPAGLAVSVTYDGQSQAPTNAGSYAIVATVTEPGYTGSASGTMVIGKATATVTLGSLSATYTGTPKAATATTNPAGLTVNFTYDGSSTAPTNAGSYSVVGAVNNTNYQGSASGTLVIGKATATVTLGSLSATYTGTPKAATATTNPAGLTVNFTYDGSGTAPTNAGSYAVVGTVSNINYQGSASGTLVIGKALATVTLGSLSATYTGAPKAATATTSPAGLTVNFTYDGSPTAPTNAGSYAVVGTVSDPNHEGSASGTLVIGKALATVTLGSLSPTYTGTPKSATATTNPAGLTVNFTYDGSPTAPTNAGSYAVVGTVSDPNHEGSASGTLVIVSAYTAWISTYADPENPAAAASGDLDSDGWDNAGEYAFGTLPNNPSSLPQLQPVLTATTMRLMVPNPPPGIVLSAETSTGLDNWTNGGIAAIPGGFEVARNGPKRFLRIVYEVVN